MSYMKALERAIFYIENNLDIDIKVEDVAKEAGYSYYHLTRQFSAILGESIGSYIRKRKLADASRKLIYTDEKIIDIAIFYGFESSESFSRAFKAIYKVSPNEYRKNKIEVMIGRKPKIDKIQFKHLTKHMTVIPEIVEIEDMNVVGIRGYTNLKDNTIPSLWNEFNLNIHKIKNVNEKSRRVGICEACDDGNTLYTMNDEVIFSEVVAVEVEKCEEVSNLFVKKTIKGGKYAVFTHIGSLENLRKTFEYIWGTWVLTTSEKLDFREDFELYDERFLGFYNVNSKMYIYIPIK